MMIRPNKRQLEVLARFLEENQGIAKGVLRTAQGKQETKMKWHELAPSLNALGGAAKNGKGWAKFWADRKCALRKMCIRHIQTINETGNGNPEDMRITDIEKRFVYAMGGIESIIADAKTYVNLLPVKEDEFAEESQSSTSDPLQIEKQTQAKQEVLPDYIDLKPHRTSRGTREANQMPTSSHFTRKRKLKAQSMLYSEQDRHERRGLIEERRRRLSTAEKKAEAELLAAKTMRDTLTRLDHCTAAIENLAAAVKETGNNIYLGLQAIADNLSMNR